MCISPTGKGLGSSIVLSVNTEVRLLAVAIILALAAGCSSNPIDQPGPLAWFEQIRTETPHIGRAVAVLADGGVVAGGGALGVAGGDAYDGVIVRLTPSGHIVWSYKAGFASNASVRALAVDSQQRVWATGNVQSTVAANVTDIFVILLDAQGNELASALYGADLGISARAIEVLSDGSAVLAGAHGSADESNAYILKVTPALAIDWDLSFGTSASDSASDVAIDGSGFIYVAGNTYGDFARPLLGGSDLFVVKFTSSGDLVWRRQLGTVGFDSLAGAALSPSGNLVLAGDSSAPFDRRLFAYRLSPAGDLVAYQFVATESFPWATAMAVDSSGGVILAGAVYGDFARPGGGSHDVFVLRLDSSGIEAWRHQLTSGPFFDAAWAVAINSEDNAFVVGQVGSATPPGNTDMFVARYWP
jgi:hypothetical protein